MDKHSLRRRLEEAKGRRVEELPQVLWSYHTIPHSTTQETPFRLMFKMDAVISNKEEIRADLDLPQEVCEVTHIKEVSVKARAT
ncbi:hypothetical protein CR513_28333, partial [Mucuna pruriens]